MNLDDYYREILNPMVWRKMREWGLIEPWYEFCL
jgi:hypothetical protein